MGGIQGTHLSGNEELSLLISVMSVEVRCFAGGVSQLTFCGGPRRRPQRNRPFAYEAS